MDKSERQALMDKVFRETFRTTEEVAMMNYITYAAYHYGMDIYGLRPFLVKYIQAIDESTALFQVAEIMEAKHGQI